MNVLGIVPGTQVAIWLSVWYMRYIKDDSAALPDLYLSLATAICANVGTLRAIWTAVSNGSATTRVVTISTPIAVTILSRYFGRKTSSSSKRDVDSSSEPYQAELKPMLFPSKTIHTRNFPQRHSFGYSYLLVGIPVGWQGRHTSMLSAETGNGWFSVQSTGFLARGGNDQGLHSKLCDYLQSQGVSRSEWSHAYLVTAPRFLGYSFNPVSFWYMYDEDFRLVMMILEVNNTFGERHMYLLKAGHEKPEEILDTENSSPAPGSPMIQFSNTWAKDFHVSPFNSRKGTYTLNATDPFGRDKIAIRNTIVLKSSKEHGKLVATVFSTQDAIDPTEMTTWQSCRFLLAWWWTGFMTLPRILKEAYTLYFKRRLNLFYRPEVVPQSIGRMSTSEERVIEDCFAAYLGRLVQQCPSALRLVYRPPGDLGAVREFSHPGRGPIDRENVQHLEIHVLTPAFYSRFVHYTHSSEAFDRECFFTDERNRTVWVSHPKALLEVQRADRNIAKQSLQLPYLQSVRWTLLRYLRCPPAGQAYMLAKPEDPSTVTTDIRPAVLSGLDCFVTEQCTKASAYRRAVVRLFLAQRYFGGFTEILQLLDITLRVALLSVGTVSLQQAGTADIRSSSKLGLLLTGVNSLLAVNSIHLWSWLKG